MNPEEINRLIAEKCGWTHPRPETKTGFMHPPGCDGAGLKPPPNYFGSLDACLEFEATIGNTIGKDQWAYIDALIDTCRTDGWTICNDIDRFHLVTATPAQRAEAFLRMHGLWNEEPKP